MKVGINHHDKGEEREVEFKYDLNREQADYKLRHILLDEKEKNKKEKENCIASVD